VPLALVVPLQTQIVSSWFFGSGAKLIASRTTEHSLDQALLDRPAGSGSGAGVGGAFVRGLSGRLKIEVSVDLSDAAIELATRTKDEIEASRKSFEKVFRAVSQIAGDDSSSNATAVVAYSDSKLEVQSSAALRIMLLETPRYGLYAVAGGGVVSSLSPRQTTRLTGDYQFRSLSGSTRALSAYHEMDVVELKALGDRHRPFAVFGGGLERRVSRRMSALLDVRLRVNPESVRVTLSASPNVMTVSDPAIAGSGIVSISTAFESAPPSVLLFNNNRELSAIFPSSLSGPGINDLLVFSGHQTRMAVNLRFGLSCRF
jgi:hypothetical protein